MAIYPTIKTGGGNIEMAVESALGTPGSYLDFRVCDDADPSFPTATREVRGVSSKGYWDPAEREAQLSYEKAAEGAGSISTYLTGCSSASGTPQAVKILESMGCTVVAGSNTYDTLDAYTNTSSWSGSITSAALVAGTAGMVEDTSHRYWPFLCYSNSGTAAYNQVPTMAIPAASENGADLVQCWTITPPKGAQVSTSKTLAFRVSDYFVTSTETGSCFVYTGCAAAELKPVTFEAGSPVKLDFSIHIADRAFDQSGIDLTAPAYIDHVSIPFIDGNGSFLMGYCDHASPIAYPLAATRTTGIRKAVWNPGIKVIPIAELGATTSVNGWGGYLGYYTGSTIEITADVDKEYWTRLESSGSQTPKYLELVQRTPAESSEHHVPSTGFGLWMPKCNMIGTPSVDLYSETEMTVTFTLEPSSANITTTSKTAQGNQPWYLGIGPVY